MGYLSSLPDGSLGGLFAAQVVEHLEPAYLLSFLELAFHKLRPGGRLVLETLNPSCWVAFFESYIRDITHVLAAAPRDAAVPRRRQRLHQRATSSTGRRSPTPTSCSR